MDEAARCDRIALLQGGQLLRPPATPDTVAESYGAPLVRVRARGKRPEILRMLRRIDAVSRADVFGERIHVTDTDNGVEELARRVERQLAAAGFHDSTAEPARPSVEDVFMALMSDSSEPEGPSHV